MLGLETLREVDNYITPKVVTVFENELDIDPEKELYLFTWSPDPTKLPDADFNIQHQFCFPFVADLLSTVECGLACVEETQLAHPHYHGWYQLSSDPVKNTMKKAYVKTMIAFSHPKFGLKITKSLGHYKINSYVQHSNCLYYYKKDLLEASLLISDNPVTKNSKTDIEWKYHIGFFTINNKRESIADLEAKISLREFYKGFYFNSL